MTGCADPEGVAVAGLDAPCVRDRLLRRQKDGEIRARIIVAELSNAFGQVETARFVPEHDAFRSGMSP